MEKGRTYCMYLSRNDNDEPIEFKSKINMKSLLHAKKQEPPPLQATTPPRHSFTHLLVVYLVSDELSTSNKRSHFFTYIWWVHWNDGVRDPFEIEAWCRSRDVLAQHVHEKQKNTIKLKRLREAKKMIWISSNRHSWISRMQVRRKRVFRILQHVYSKRIISLRINLDEWINKSVSERSKRRVSIVLSIF